VLAKEHDFGGDIDLTFDRLRARELSDAAATPVTRARASRFDCLFSDAATKKDGSVMATPLCAMFGRGHQHFLSRLAQVANGTLPKSMARLRSAPDLNSADKIEEALFRPWTRPDETHGFRWDPMEDRRYALRFKNPSGDAGRAVHGANRLAAIGITARPGAAVDRRGGLRFLTLGSGVGAEGLIEITWPIWERLISLSAMQALLGRPALYEQAPDRALLARFGIAHLRRARRINVGKYFNFTRAEAI
jgi:hypothetical protein